MEWTLAWRVSQVEIGSPSQYSASNIACVLLGLSIFVSVWFQVEDFRKFFMKTAPFFVPDEEIKLEHVAPAYKILDQFHHGTIEKTLDDGSPVVYDSVSKIRMESKQLQEFQDLFEL